MRRETIAMIWIGGFILAAVLYLIGPDRFFEACLNLIDGLDAAFRTLVERLGAQAYGVIRALAIALYIVFAVLAVLASHKGQRGIGSLLLVTGVFLVLVWRPYDLYPTPISRWIAALVLVVIGAIVMSQRLTIPPPSRQGPPPYPPGSRPL